MVDRTDSFIYLSTDIGIGGAVVRDGEVVMGSHGFAGEIGHLSVAMDGPLCSCGRHGCLEAFAGRRALVEAAGIAEDGDATSSEAIDMFLQRWRAGDSDVAKVVDQAADALVSAIASAVNLVDVDTVLLGGLWTHFGDELATVLEGRLRSEILGYPNVKIRVFAPPVALHPRHMARPKWACDGSSRTRWGTWGEVAPGDAACCWRVHGMGAWRACRH